MLFGYVDDSELSGIDFTLPGDPEMTTNTLTAFKGTGNLKAFIGCTRWAQKAWVGSLYPKGTKQTDFLKAYARQFNTIEFGSTFYTIWKAEDLKTRFADLVEGNPDFRFCPKLWNQITHFRRLKNAQDATARFFDSLKGLGDHLGPVLMQVAENYMPKDISTLTTYFDELQSGVPVFLEVRNKEWFSNSTYRNQLFGMLHEHSVGAVISDTPGCRDVVHMHLPTPHAMIRFVGNNGSDLEKRRLDAWVERLKSWKEQGLQALWFFMHQHDEVYAPASCAYFIGRLNEKLGLEIKKPALLAQ
jgi:uncharacterized protein YecE (DUF72 family)